MQYLLNAASCRPKYETKSFVTLDTEGGSWSYSKCKEEAEKQGDGRGSPSLPMMELLYPFIIPLRGSTSKKHPLLSNVKCRTKKMNIVRGHKRR